MSKKTTVLFVFFALLTLAACASPTVPATPTPTFAPPAVTATQPAPTTAAPPTGSIAITILHTNDMHGYIEGEKLTGGDGTTFEFGGIPHAMGTLARLKQEAKGPTITLDDGDFWQGTFASNRDDGKAIVAAMNAVGYDALTLGNHDFDHGQDVVRARAAEANFPFLAANIIEESSGKSPAWVKPYIVKEIAGIRIGIIGLTNSGTAAISKASNWKGLKFVNEVEALQQVLPEVKSKADIVVVLSHNGIDREQRLAAAVAGVDVIVSGHTHVEQRNSRVVGSTIVVHAGYKAKFVGRLELQIDTATKRIIDFTRSNEVVPVVSNKAMTPQPVVAMFDNLLTDARDATNRPVGETLIDLNRVFTSDGRSTGEYPSGNLVVDAMLAANQVGDRPADIALHNNAGIRTDIPKGPLTYGQLYEMLPFDNVLTAMDLNGAQVKAILEHATSCPRVNILVAGMSFEYDCNKPQGQRTSNIVIRGKPLDPQQVYRVETIDYLASGGDGQTTFTQGTNLAYGDPVIDVVVEYVRKNSPVNPKVEGRITPAH